MLQLARIGFRNTFLQRPTSALIPFLSPVYLRLSHFASTPTDNRKGQNFQDKKQQHQYQQSSPKPVIKKQQEQPEGQNYKSREQKVAPKQNINKQRENSDFQSKPQQGYPKPTIKKQQEQQGGQNYKSKQTQQQIYEEPPMKRQQQEERQPQHQHQYQHQHQREHQNYQHQYKKQKPYHNQNHIQDQDHDQDQNLRRQPQQHQREYQAEHQAEHQHHQHQYKKQKQYQNQDQDQNLRRQPQQHQYQKGILQEVRESPDGMAERSYRKSDKLLNWRRLKNFEVFQAEIIPMAKDVEQTSRFLESLLSESEDVRNFEKEYFKNYEFFMSEVLRNIKDSESSDSLNLDALLSILHSQSKIYLFHGKLQTSNLNRLQGKLKREILASLKSLSPKQMYLLIESLSNFESDIPGSLIRNNDYLISIIRELDSENLPNFLRYLAKIKYSVEGVIEILTEKLYKHIDQYELKAKINSINALNIIRYKPNKTFFVKLCESISQDIEKLPYGELYYTYIPNFLFSVSELEKRYTGGGFYLGEIDRLYAQVIESLHKNIEKYNSLEIYRICSALQRCSVYDEKLLRLILNEVLKREFFGFSEGGLQKSLEEMEKHVKEVQEKIDLIPPAEKDTKEYRDLLIDLKKSLKTKADLVKEIKEKMNNLNNFSGIVHAFAVFNFQDGPFLEFTNKIIELYYLKFLHEKKNYLEFLDQSNIPKLIWSLCVLGQPSEIKKSVKYLSNILLQSDYKKKLNLIDVTQLYYSVVYLKDTGVYDTETIDFMLQHFQELNKNAIKTISMLHLEISQVLKKLEVGHSIEERIELIPVDIVMEQRTKNGKRIVMDFHGYNHFFRNMEEVKGNAVLKRKILENLGCEYIEITIFDWLLLAQEQKEDYLRVRIVEKVRKASEN